MKFAKAWIGLGLFTPLLVVACATHFSEESDTSPKVATHRPAAAEKSDAILDKYSLEQLDSVATYGTELILLALNPPDGKKPTRILKCDPASGVADTWMMPLKSLIDAKIAKEQEAYLKKTTTQRTKDKRFSQCEKTCNCGVYASLIQAIDDNKLTSADRELENSLVQRQGALSDEASLACAKQASWFCQSPLLDYLKNEAL